MSAMNGLRSLRETMPLIRAEAQEALTLDPSDPGPHILLASVAAAYEYDWKAARDLFETGMAGPSTSAEAHWAYASLFLQPLGRHEEAVAHMERAVERDPLNAHWRGVLASHLTHARRAEDAIRQANEALEIDEGSLAGHVTLGEAYISIERWEEAAASLEKAHTVFPQHSMPAGLLAGTLIHLERSHAGRGIDSRDGGNAAPAHRPRLVSRAVLRRRSSRRLVRTRHQRARAVRARVRGHSARRRPPAIATLAEACAHDEHAVSRLRCHRHADALWCRRNKCRPVRMPPAEVLIQPLRLDSIHCHDGVTEDQTSGRTRLIRHALAELLGKRDNDALRPADVG